MRVRWIIPIFLFLTVATDLTAATTTAETKTTMEITTTESTTQATTTTPTLTTTRAPAETRSATTALASEPTFIIIADLPQEPFTEELHDRDSQRSKEIEAQVVTAFDSIFRARFSLLFVRTFVIRFRDAQDQQTRVEGTQADMGIVFNSTTPVEELPTNNDVAETLRDAINNPNNTLNVSLSASSVQVLESPVTTATNTSTTAAPANATTTTSAPTTVAPTTAPATTSSLVTRRVSFRSVKDTFTVDLLDSSSEAFKSRTSIIEKQLQPRYQRAFNSFKNLTVTSFSNGSVINNFTLSFDATSVPNITQVANVLIEAASNVTGFDIETSSITVDGTVSSGVSHKISVVTAFSLVLLSWLLSSQQ